MYHQLTFCGSGYIETGWMWEQGSFIHCSAFSILCIILKKEMGSIQE